VYKARLDNNNGFNENFKSKNGSLGAKIKVDLESYKDLNYYGIIQMGTPYEYYKVTFDTSTSWTWLSK
jgi:hypothetical protein